MGANSSRPAIYDAPAYGCISVYLFLTTLAIIARGTSRYMQKVAFGTDDALAYVTYVANAAALVTEYTVVAMGAMNLERYTNFTPEQELSFKNKDRADSILYIATIACAKLSVLFLYRRIFGMYEPWFKAFWWFNAVIVTPAWAISTLALFIWAQVHSFHFALKQTAYATAATSLLNVLSDIMILALPIGGVLRLHLSGSRKAGTIAIFCLGFLTTLISLTRLIVEFRQAAAGPLVWNAAYSVYNFSIISYAETSAATLCACIPVSLPAILKMTQVASRNLSAASLRAFISRTSATSANRTSSDGTNSVGSERKDTITHTRTFDVDSESVERAESNPYRDPVRRHPDF